MRGIVPFGDQTFLQIDLYHQYAPFHAELRERLLNGNSIFYSWEGGLGKEFLPQLAYYTSSPWNLLIFLFPEKNLPEFIHVLIAVKMGLAGAAFAWYLQKTQKLTGGVVLAFSLLYAWCGFNVCYYWNIMWLDAVAVFPIATYGLEQLILNGKWHLYTGSLAVIILSNFYIAFLVCIFMVLYFVLVIFLEYNKNITKQDLIRVCVQFFISSVLSGMLLMVLILPTAIALSHTAVSDAEMPGVEIYRNIYQILSVHMVGARPVVLGTNADLPNLYSGILTILLVFCFFMNHEISAREKIGYGILVGCFLFCCILKPLDFVIHGGHFPANLPHRFVFIYTFLLLKMAAQSWRCRKGIKNWQWWLAAILLLMCTYIPEFVIVPRMFELDRVYTNSALVIGYCMLMGYVVFCCMREKNFQKKSIQVLFVLLVSAECLYSGWNGMDHSTDRAEYTQYMDDMKNATEKLKTQADGNLERMEFRRFQAINGGALFHYPGVSQFSSLAPGGISKVMRALGVAATGNSYRYYDPTPIIDGFLDVCYVLNQGKPGDTTTVLEHYEPYETEGDIWIYKNPMALPIGFAVSDQMLSWEPQTGNPFQAQEELISKSLGNTVSIYQTFSWNSYESENVSIEMEDENRLRYRVNDPADLSKVPKVTAHFLSDCRQYVYLYADVANTKRLVYETEKERQDREISTGNSMIDIGWVDKGEEITVTLQMTDHGEFEKSYRESGEIMLVAAGYDSAVWENAYQQLAEHPWKLTKCEDTLLTGTIEADNGQILFTSIPYSQGWSAVVDGENAEIIPLGGNGVVGVALTPGKHVVSLKYWPPGFNVGALISIISVLILLVMLWVKKRRNLKK